MPMNNEDIDALAKQALLHGDEAAWTLLVKEIWPDLKKEAWKMLDEEHAAEDIAQKALLKMCQVRKTYRGKTFLAWAFTINRTVCIDMLRKRKTRSQHECIPGTDLSYLSDSGDGPQEKIESEEDKTRRVLRLEYCLKQLSGKQREVIRLRFLEKEKDTPQPLEAIADTIGIALSSVHTRLKRALKNLFVCLGSDSISVLA